MTDNLSGTTVTYDLTGAIMTVHLSGTTKVIETGIFLLSSGNLSFSVVGRLAADSNSDTDVQPAPVCNSNMALS